MFSRDRGRGSAGTGRVPISVNRRRAAVINGRTAAIGTPAHRQWVPVPVNQEHSGSCCGLPWKLGKTTGKVVADLRGRSLPGKPASVFRFHMQMARAISFCRFS